MNNIKELQRRAKLPTNDIIFHCLFGTVGNEGITKDFLENVLKRRVEKIDLDKNLNLVRNYYDEKLGVLDVRAKDSNGVNYNIEMQNIKTNSLPERVLSYWSRLYTGDLRTGKNYDTLNKTIAILIVNDEIEKLGIIQKFHTKWNIREENYTEIILTEDLEIHILELKKYGKMKTSENKNVWLDFLVEPEGEEVLEAMKKSRELKEAKEKWQEISEDEIIRDRALRLEIAELDYNTGMKHAREEGIQEGIEKGVEQGKNVKKIEMIRQMLKENIDIEIIAKVTESTVEEIEKFKKS